MSRERTRHVDGYTYGAATTRSPVAVPELSTLKGAVRFTQDDEQALHDASHVFRRHAEELADEWRAVIAEQPQLARYYRSVDGRSEVGYSAATRGRLVQWIVDVCTRPYDQEWLDYQHEIGLRHTRAKKNRTDGAHTPDHVPMRYVVAFVPVVFETTREMLRRCGYSDALLDTVHTAWCRAVMLHVVLWTRAYVDPAYW